MNNFAEKKPDYIFIASLIAIIFVAVYLAMDRFKNSYISEYLHTKGQELLAQIDNQQERENLQSEYNRFIKKVAEREIDSEKVEQFVSTMYSLNQVKPHLKEEEFARLMENNLKNAFAADTVKKLSNQVNDKWKKLQDRLEDIHSFEEKLKEIEKAPQFDKSYSFSYTIDDTLNIVVNEQFKDNLAKQAELSKELKRLEKDRTLVWEKDIAWKERESLEKAIQELGKVSAAVSVISAGKDSVKVTVSTPAIKATAPEPAQAPTPVVK